MGSTDGSRVRLVQLVTEANELEPKQDLEGFLFGARAQAWRLNAISVLCQLCGGSHIYSQAFKEVTKGLSVDAPPTYAHVRSCVTRGSLILMALNRDCTAGCNFDSPTEGFSAERAETADILIRIELLLEKLLQVLVDQKPV